MMYTDEGKDRYDTEFVRHITQSLAKMLEPHVVSIYVKQDARFAQHGTGTLLKVADRSFLVTAAHVLIEADKDGFPLYVADYDVGCAFQRLRGTQHFIRESRVDVAVVELASDLIECLANRKFLRLADMDFQDHVREGLFFLLGYPCELNPSDSESPTIAGKYLGYVTRAYDGTLRATSYDPRFHLLLSAKKSSSRAIGSSKRTFPEKLSGISGTAIWRTNAKPQGQSEWKPEFAKMLAIETLAYGDQHEIIRGTHVSAIIRILGDACPDLNSVLRMHLPF
jgi:hypothetical protein